MVTRDNVLNTLSTAIAQTQEVLNTVDQQMAQLSELERAQGRGYREIVESIKRKYEEWHTEAQTCDAARLQELDNLLTQIQQPARKGSIA